MRTPTITTPLDDSCDPEGWRADTVDPRGWLAGAGSTSRLPRADTDARADTDDGRPTEPTDGSPAGAARSAVRTARRPAGVRRRRRVHTRSTSRSLAADRAVEADQLASTTATRPPAAAVEPAVDGYRMGRWARLTLTLTVLTAVAVVTMSLVVGSAPQAMVDITVGPGDTLWSIASQAAPDRDPREVIEQIRELNELPGGVLPVGIVLRVPTSVE